MWSVLESYHSHVREIIKAARTRGQSYSGVLSRRGAKF